MNWFYLDDGEQRGPHTEQEMLRGFREGELFSYTLVRPEDDPEWRPYAEYFGAGGAPFMPYTPDPASAETTPDDGPEPQPPGLASCSVCSRVFPADDLIAYLEQRICMDCKPGYFQRLREGFEQPPALVYALFGRRAGARILDGIFLAGLNFFLLLPFGFKDDARLGLLLLQNLITLALEAVYFVYFHATTGATPGKAILKIRVVTEQGAALGYPRAIGRYFAQYLSVFTLGIGFLMAAFDPQHRALHDHICGTRVIRPARAG